MYVSRKKLRLKETFNLYLQVHYHVVPAPTFESSSGVDSESTDGVPGDNKTSTIYQEMLQNEFNARKEIDRQDAEILVTQIRARFDGNSV